MPSRIRTIYLGFLLVIVVIVLRLSYWQLVRGPSLRSQAREQHLEASIVTPTRGEILTADGYPLVANRPVYTLGVYTPQLKISGESLVASILPLLDFEIEDPKIATDEAAAKIKLTELKEAARTSMLSRLSTKSFTTLASGLREEQKEEIAKLKIEGASFEESFRRSYPEASVSASLTGFVGRDDVGAPQGYFGLEGYYNEELEGRAGVTKEETDATGNPLLIGDFLRRRVETGRSLELHLERSVQYIAYEELQKALVRYGASGGEVLIMDPSTGGILAMVSLPSYSADKFYLANPTLYKNPSVSNAYEPGSTFKVLVMAAALDSGKLELTDKCDICSGPLPVDKYLIKTWNGKYHPDSTPEDILVNSDNVGMVWIERLMTGEVMRTYLSKFGIGKKTGIDLEEEIAPPVRDKWGDIDYATSSFGQGIVVTSIELLRAVSAIANGGVLVEPHVVSAVLGDKKIPIPPKVEEQVISKKTASEMTELMIKSAEHGDAKWTRLPDYSVAGKTGTAQIPVSGHYDEARTIASFVGFAPSHNPRFAMLVKLENPTTSPWGSETAAPLWFTIARRLLLHYNIPSVKR